MGFVRFQTAADDIRCGYLAGSSVHDLSGKSLYKSLDTLPDVLSSENRVYDRSEVTLLPPADPETIVRLEGCYEHNATNNCDPHLGELASGDTPSLWVSPTDSIAAADVTVSLPSIVNDIRPGVALGLIIGEQVRNLSPEKANQCIAGYVVCRILKAHDPHPGLYGYQMFPGFLGVGPTAVPEITLPVALGVRRDGETVDRSSTTHLRFSLGKLVSYASHVFTLEAGDLLVTGDPIRSMDPIESGETVTAWIESIGQQTTTLVDEVSS